MNTYSRVYAAVDLDAILHNMEEMHRIIDPRTKIMAVIKTDGYGHGAVEIGAQLEKLSYVWGYAVATVEEGLILRRHELKKPILVLGATFPEQYEAMARHGLRPTVYSLEMAEKMSTRIEQLAGQEQLAQLRIHVKIDTGLSRLGFQTTPEAADEIAQIATLPHIVVEGVFTHFVKADSDEQTMTRKQLQAFSRMCQLLEERQVKPELVHASNSAGILDLKEANLDLVRAGISIYGLWPSEEMRQLHQDQIKLRPALSLISQIVMLKELEPGRTISYGATYQVERPSRIATVPVGYGDGYPRSLSNCGRVLIHGKPAPICGRICMDQFMVDVTDILEAKEGDQVVLVGQSQDVVLTMEELGALSGRFNYEFACDLGKRIPRVYYQGGAAVSTKDYFGE